MSSKISLITGGSRSGKSRYAESLYKDTDDVLYIATAVITDKEMEDRVRMHRQSRNQRWDTAEQYRDLDNLIYGSKNKNILLDCVTIMISNLMFDSAMDVEGMKQEDLNILEDQIMQEFKKLIKATRIQEKNLILVTNELGSGIVPEYKLGRIFRDIAGRVNQEIARMSDNVYLVSCGLPIKLK